VPRAFFTAIALLEFFATLFFLFAAILPNTQRTITAEEKSSE
jgi:hypothetical protein